MRSSSVCFHNHLSLRYLWVLLVPGVKHVAVLHAGLDAKHSTWRQRLFAKVKKLSLSQMDVVVVVSSALMDEFPGAVVIENFFDESVFYEDGRHERVRNRVAFVGRLVPEKGCHWLLEAAALLERERTLVEIVVIGDGPERGGLEDYARGLDSTVAFLGAIGPPEVNRELNRCSILAVPSNWGEPFGIVALEGAAAGCRVVASDDGGLRYAAGPCGVLVPPGDPAALARAIRVALGKKLSPEEQTLTRVHLHDHSTAAVVARYDDIMRGLSVPDRSTVGFA